jgi:hypothetical protein
MTEASAPDPARRSAGSRAVWLGIHIRSADTAGVQVGQAAADYGLDHYFAPSDD